MKTLICAALALATAVASNAAAADPRQDAIDKAFTTIDTNRDGRIDKAEYSRFSQAKFAKQARSMDTAFDVMDANKDGKIVKAEAAMVPAIATYFDGLDGDKDGALSRAEMQQAMTAAQAAESDVK